ncbi:MAG: hypothetical protein IIY70_03715, partial [Oscillospiraceae bacterium]|nr:hypothetical protein [Oscillospiraceae bacterium]
MERSVRRILRNEAYIFLAVLLAFSATAAVRQDYWMSAALAFAAIVMMTATLFVTRQRVKAIASNVQFAVDTLIGTATSAAPWPTALIRLDNGEILWHDRQFQKMLNTAESQVGDCISQVIPELGLDWLKSGKQECPNDLQIRDRRFRCLGFTPKADSGSIPTAQMIWIDSTDLLDTRDEYLRSRPVVSIILIDNYDELTNNMTDTEVSNLNAALNERISLWTGKIG